MKLTKKELRRLILQEIRLLNESFSKAKKASKADPKNKYYFYDARDKLVHVLKNGTVVDNIKDVEPGTKKYKNLAIQGKGKKIRSFGF